MLIKSKKTSAAPPLYISKQLQDICKEIEKMDKRIKTIGLQANSIMML